jgi:uncharacterized integral membrane protein
MKFTSWLFTIPIIIVCVVFAVSNRQEVTIDLWPLDYIVTSPLYVLTLGFFFCGFLFGSLLFWLTSLRHRWDKRKLSKQVDKLKTQLDDEKSKKV